MKPLGVSLQKCNFTNSGKVKAPRDTADDGAGCVSVSVDRLRNEFLSRPLNVIAKCDVLRSRDFRPLRSRRRYDTCGFQIPALEVSQKPVSYVIFNTKKISPYCDRCTSVYTLQVTRKIWPRASGLRLYLVALITRRVEARITNSSLLFRVVQHRCVSIRDNW